MSRGQKLLAIIASLVAGGIIAHALPARSLRLPKDTDPFDGHPIGIGA